MILATVIFTIYIAYYWRSGTKSISLTAYENGDWSRLGFFLMMASVGIVFAHFEGKEFWGFSAYAIAGGFLCLAGLSFNHQTPTIKQIHHVSSSIAITFGFIALWNLYAVLIFAILTGIAYFVGRDRFLWFLEIVAFYVIIIFKICVA